MLLEDTNISIAKSDIWLSRPLKNNDILNVQWTWDDVDRCFGIDRTDVMPLKTLWLNSSNKLPDYLRNTSPRLAVQATGMTLRAFQRVAEQVQPGVQEYDIFYPLMAMFTYHGDTTNRHATALLRGPTPVSRGARRKPVQEFGLRQRAWRGDKQLTKHDERSLQRKLMDWPSYGDDLSNVLLMYFRPAVKWLQRISPRFNHRALHVNPGTLEEYRALLKEMVEWDGDHEMLHRPPEAVPCDPYTTCFTALSFFITRNWTQLYRMTTEPQTGKTERIAAMIAVGMMREQIFVKYRKHIGRLQAPTLLGVSRLTGVPPIVFMNYFRDHYYRTSVMLLSRGQAEALIRLVEDEPCSAAQSKGKDELLAEMEAWMNDPHLAATALTEEIERLMDEGEVYEWTGEDDDDE